MLPQPEFPSLTTAVPIHLSLCNSQLIQKHYNTSERWASAEGGEGSLTQSGAPALKELTLERDGQVKSSPDWPLKSSPDCLSQFSVAKPYSLSCSSCPVL